MCIAFYIVRISALSTAMACNCLVVAFQLRQCQPWSLVSRAPLSRPGIPDSMGSPFDPVQGPLWRGAAEREHHNVILAQSPTGSATRPNVQMDPPAGCLLNTACRVRELLRLQTMTLSLNLQWLGQLQYVTWIVHMIAYTNYIGLQCTA